MVETGSPVARSPVAPLPPVGVVAGWEVSLARSAAALTLADWTPLAKVLLRMPPRSGAAPAVAFGAAARDAAGTLVVGHGPGEWLLLGPPGAAAGLVARWSVDGSGGDDLRSVVDVTSGRALLRLTGRRASDLLAKVCAVDLSRARNGSAFRSPVAQVPASVVRDDVAADAWSYLVACDRSVGAYLHGALLDAGAEFGIGATGFHPRG